MGIGTCEDTLIVSLAPDRTDNGHLVYIRAPLQTSTNQHFSLPISFSNVTNINELEYDPFDQTLFMNDISSSLYIIKNFSGNTQTDKLTSNVIRTFSSPSSKIAVDWLSKNIYHLDPSYNWITVQPIKGVGDPNRRTVVDGLFSPKSIAVDPLNGFLIWSAEYGKGSAIWKSSLSGSDQNLLLSGLLLVTDIVVDETERRIFWLDIGRETLETCRYDGLDRRVLKRSPSLLMSMSGLTLYQNILCVAIQFAYLVECINKQTGETVWQHLFQWPKDGKYEYKVPQALTFIQDKDQGNETQRCEEKGCEFICIGPKDDVAKCLCPDGLKLTENGINCTQNTMVHQKSLLLSNTSSICFVDVLVLTGMPAEVNCVLHWNKSISHYAVDTRNNKIYFEDSDNKKLLMFDISTGLIKELLSVSVVSGLCVDWLSSNIYWTERNTGLIMFVNERFPMEMPVFQNVDHPSGLAINPLNRTLYWISGVVGTFIIEAGTYDGVERWVAVNSKHLKNPSELSIDIKGHRLWWVDIDGVYSMDLETNEIQIYTSYNIISFTKYKDYLLLLKNQGEVRITNIKSPGIHRHLDVPYIFTKAVVYDQSQQPISEDICRVRNGDCEHICIPRLNGTKTCKCRLGYKLRKDRKTCQTLPLQSDFVLTVDFTHATIFQVSMADANVVAIDVSETIRPVNAIFHPLDRNLIYSDAMYREIRQLSMSGRKSVTLTNTGLFEPQALVMDPSTGHLIYSAVSTKSYIGILNIETRERKTVVPGLTSVYNIAIHPQKGYLFWSDLVYSASYIGRSYMDGSAMINLIFKDISQPNSLTLDYKNDFLYWTDGDLGTINFCDLDGKNRGILLQDRRQKFRHFDISGDHIYYTALDDQKITKASLITAKEIAWMNYSAEFGKLQSLQVYGEKVIPVHSVCSVSNGRCSTFCLPTSRGRKCACPDAVNLQNDKRTCEGVVKCPEIIPNGKVSPDCAPYVGNECTYTCNSGLRPSMSGIICQGTWNVSALEQLCVTVPTQRLMTDPTNDGAIAGGIVAASLAVTIVLVLIIIFLCRRASDSPAPDSGAIHYVNGGQVNRNGVNGARKGSRVIIEEGPSINHSNT
ncbi:low-density lipoprotein receptor-related protein 4-like [Saccostrea cucullata]|uniref:low-density lipoprotein receptor-related protein 4-like n=1 Tax=Saccostrea cuccullata TaxID=36930 RepID=UPI002ED53307